MHQLYGPEGQQRGLFCRLGHHRVTGRQVRQNLASKDRQREVPGRDTTHHTTGLAVMLVTDAFVGIEHGKIHGLANLGHGIQQGFTGFAGRQRKQLVHVLFVKVTDLTDHGRTLFRRYSRPLFEAILGGVQSRRNIRL